ncbi:MAG TPA: thiamine-phosphate kinase, partial [Candidatus Methylacidiphilales bacterium]|nr:thiamine-phosphate kinase [Candidatus Methylacidiphilales bacterium]
MFRSEDDLWQQLTKNWPVTPGKVLTGAGDDCAVLQGCGCGGEDGPESVTSSRFLLFKTDIVVEDVHFTAKASPRLVGRKALNRAVSDIAAMGGRPGAALVTLGLPPETSISRLRALYQGLNDAAKTSGVALAGGETTRSPRLFLNVALLGETRGHSPVLRSTAQPGDLIWVTGRLGATQKKKHLTFTPRLAEGEFLASHGFATSMMDISDGLGKDLPRLARASHLGCH